MAVAALGDQRAELAGLVRVLDDLVAGVVGLREQRVVHFVPDVVGAGHDVAPDRGVETALPVIIQESSDARHHSFGSRAPIGSGQGTDLLDGKDAPWILRGRGGDPVWELEMRTHGDRAVRETA